MKAFLHRWAATAVYVAALLAAFVLLGRLHQETRNQRIASCKATLVALAAIRENATAGIRPVSAMPADLSATLRASFLFQARRTAEANARYRKVVMRVDKAASDLRASDFCRA